MVVSGVGVVAPNGIGKDAFFPTLGGAVGSYLKHHAVEWVDWEDRSVGAKGE